MNDIGVFKVLLMMTERERGSVSRVWLVGHTKGARRRSLSSRSESSDRTCVTGNRNGARSKREGLFVNRLNRLEDLFNCQIFRRVFCELQSGLSYTQSKRQNTTTTTTTARDKREELCGTEEKTDWTDGWNCESRLIKTERNACQRSENGDNLLSENQSWWHLNRNNLIRR